MPDGFDQEDPFKKYGGKQVADTIEDPFKKYGGVAIEDPVKKKELGSLLGGMAGNGLSQSNGKVLEKQKGNIQDESIGIFKAWQDVQTHKLKKSNKEIEEEAVNRLKGISPENIYFTPQQETSKIYEKDDDPIGNQVRKLQHEKDNLIKNTKNPENAFVLNELSVKDKQAELLKSYAIPSGNEATYLVKQFLDKNIGGDSGNINQLPIEEIKNNLPKDNITAQVAFDKYAKKRKIDELDKQYQTFDELALNLYGEKSESDAKRGQRIEDALNDPDIIEKTKESADFANKYRQAQFDLYRNYPSHAFKKIGQLIGQKLEDKGMTGWLYANPSLEKVTKAIDMLREDGVWGAKEDEVFKERMLADVAAGNADKVIPLTDLAHKTGYGLYYGAKGFESSSRDLTNKLFGGLFDKNGNSIFQNVGLMENNEDRAKRLEQEENATPQVEPKRFMTKYVSPIGEFTGQFAPMILGSAVKVPQLLNIALNFEGHWADEARKKYKGNVGLQNLYTLTHTGIDMFAMHYFPTQKIAEGFKRVIGKDVVNIIDDLADKKITQDVAKKTFLEKTFNAAKSVGKLNTQSANVLFGLDVLHKTSNAAFGGRDLKLEDELSESVEGYLTNWLNSSFLSGVGAMRGSESTNGKVLRRISENPNKYRELVQSNEQLSPTEKQDRLDKIDRIEAVSAQLSVKKLKPEQIEGYLNKDMQQYVAQKAVKESADKVLAKEDERKAKIAEIEKEHILNPMSNTALAETLFEHLPKGSQEKLSTEGEFDKTKVTPYLEYIAKQSNGLDENWKPHEDGRIPKMTGIPESIVKAANEKFAKEIESSQEPIKEETGEPPVSGVEGGDVETQYNERKKAIEDKLNKQLEDNKDILDDIDEKGGTKTVRQRIYQEHTNDMVELEKWKMKEDLKKEDTPDGRMKKNSEFSANQLTDAIPNSEVHYENKEDYGVTTITLRDKNTKKHIASIDIGTGDTIDGYAGVRIQVNGEHQGKGLSKHLYNLALTEAKKQGLKGLYTIDEMLKTPDKTIATRDNFVTRENTDEKLKTQARKKYTNVADPHITFIENVSDKFIKKGATKLSEKSPTQEVKAEQPTVSGKEVEDAEYNEFIDKGKVSEERLNDIANKVKNQESLSDREKEIFTDKTSEINKIIAGKEVGSGGGGDVVGKVDESTDKQRKRTIVNHLLDSEGDVDGAFEKAGYVNHNGIWVAPEALEYAKKVSSEAWQHLKDKGVKFLEGGDDSRGLQKGIAYGDKTIRGIGINERVGEFHSGHDHTVLHETAHHVWQEELTPEQKKVFADDSPVSDYAKSVKDGKEKTMGKYDEEDFAELYAKNKGDINKAIEEKKNQSKFKEQSTKVEGGDVVKQIENFGVPKEDVDATHGLLNQVFSGLKKAGLTAAKTVGDWVGIGKGSEKPYSLKIGDKEVQVKNTSPDVVNGFYSPLEKTINETKFDKLPAKQWAEKFATGEEAKWTGLQEWLKQQTGTVSKADIQQFLKDNRIQVVEVVKGSEKQISKVSDLPKEFTADGFVIRQEEDGWIRQREDGGQSEYIVPERALKYYNDEQGYIEGNATKFSQYQLEGQKENYKEVLVTLPVKETPQLKSFERFAKEEYGLSDEGVKYEKEKKGQIYQEWTKPAKAKENFKSSHFDEPNILVHLRMNTRTDAEGKKVLFLEEVQSDWGQKGKKEGFDSKDIQRKELEKRGVTFNKNGTVSLESQDKFYEKGETWDLIKKYNDTYTNRSIVPQAPFVTDTNSWTKLGLKVALKEAVKQGADKIAWTTGEQQNSRYDLSKQVDRITVSKPNEDGKARGYYHRINITEKGGGKTQLAVDKNGKVIEAPSGLFGQPLENVVGKEMAEKIMSVKEGNLKEFSGLDLQIGGKGMKGFYGSPTEGSLGIVGNVAKSLFKQEPKTTELTEGKWKEEDGRHVFEGADGTYIGDYSKQRDGSIRAVDMFGREKKFDKESDAKDYIYNSTNFHSTRQHSIDITPEMKAEVEGKGQPLFKDAEAQYRIESGKNIIEAIKDFNQSKNKARATVALTHEIMHPTVVSIIDGAKEGNEVGKKHTETIVNEFNKANPNSKVTVEDLIKGNDAFKDGTTSKQYRAVQEFIAKAWEKYHTEGGKGFSEAFQKVLDQITKAFQSVYKSITGKKLTPELKQMFDDILGKEQSTKVEEQGGGLEAGKSENATQNIENQPPEPPNPPEKAPEGEGGDEWTHINKKDITDAEEIANKHPFGESESWKNSVSKGLAKLGKLVKQGESLYDAAKNKVAEWANKVRKEIMDDGKSTFNPSDEEIAQMAFHRAMTNKKIADLEADLTSPIEGIRGAAEIIMDDLQTQKELVDYVLHNTATTAGRAFNIRQMISQIDAENGLKIKRMDIIRKQKGQPLSEKQEEEIRDIHDEEVANQKAKDEYAKKKAEQDFEEAVKAEVERRMKEQKGSKPSTKPFARTKAGDAIRKLKQPGTRLDITFGTWDLLVEGVAKLVDTGITVAEAVKRLIADGTIKFKTDKDRDEAIDHIDNAQRHVAMDSIRELAEKEKSDNLTKSAVGQNLVNDLVNHHIDKGLRGKDVFTELNKDLKEIFPEITEQQVRDAYLKEGEFKLEKKEKLNKEKTEAKAELISIAKKETDLQDLEDYRRLRKRGFKSDREKTDYENKLIADKNAKLKESSDRRKQILEDNKKIETETIRQMKRVTELTEKRDRLNKGIRDKRNVSKNIDTPEIEGLKKEVEQADKDLRAAESEVKRLQKEAQDKKDKLGELNANINRVKNGLEQIKTYRNKSEAKIDADIAAKRTELQKEMNKQGMKLEKGSKAEKEQKQKVVDLHNKRVDDIISGIDAKLADAKTTDAEKSALTNAKKLLEKSKVNKESALDIFNAVDKAEKNVELARGELAKFGNLSDIKKAITQSQIQMGKDKLSTEQDILLQRHKDNLQQKIDKNESRLESGEYVESEPTRLKTTDAEALRLEAKDRATKNKLDAVGKRAQRAAMTKREKFIDTVQSLYVIGLVGRFSTLVKVGISAITKQPLNTITSQTFGRLGGVIFPKIKNALRGEGAEGWRKEKARYIAHYGALGKEGMAKMVNKGKVEAQKADEAYLNAKDKLDDIENQYGKDSKEYKDFANGEFKKAENKQKQALLDNVTNSMYEWIGGNAWQDAAEVFLHSSAKLEQLLGHGEREMWKDKTRREKIMFVLSSSAATHGVLKNFSARAEFAANFVARLENKMKQGIDISSPEEILQTINESYVAFERGKYQENNPLTSGFKAGLEGIQKWGESHPDYKYAADLMTGILKFKNPIVRTPINIAREAIVEYFAGTILAGWKYNASKIKAGKEAKEYGLAGAEMTQYVKDYMDNLPPDKADFIYRAFRKGGFGLGMMALTALGGINYGGFFNRDERRRKKGDELGINEVEVGGHKLSHLQAKVFTHTSAFFPALLFSNYKRVREESLEAGHGEFGANVNAFMKDIRGMIDQVPLGQETSNPLQGIQIPLIGPFLQEIAESQDTDESGEKIKRVPKGNPLEKLWQNFEMKIPGLRQNVPTKQSQGNTPKEPKEAKEPKERK